jgi:hypothetical protein
MLRNSSSLRHEELPAESGRDGDAQPRGALRGVAAQRRGLQSGKPGSHVREVGRAIGREAEVAAAEELEAHMRFELPDAVAHRAGRDAQLIGRAARVTQSCDGLEGQQALDRGDVLQGHRSLNEAQAAGSFQGGCTSRTTTALKARADAVLRLEK